MKKVALLMAEGFEEVEGLTVVDYLRRADISIDMVSIMDKLEVMGSHNILVKADKLFKDIKAEDYDVYVFPGGIGNAKIMRADKTLLDFIKNANDQDKNLYAICAAPTILYDAGVLEGRNITSFPGVFTEGQSGFNYIEQNVVKDKNILTSRGPAIAVHFALAIIEEIAGFEKRKEIEKQLLFDLM